MFLILSINLGAPPISGQCSFFASGFIFGFGQDLGGAAPKPLPGGKPPWTPVSGFRCCLEQAPATDRQAVLFT